MTKDLNDEETNAVVNGRPFKKLKDKNIELYDVDVVKVQIKHKEPIVGFVTLQYAKCWNYVTTFEPIYIRFAI